MKERDKSRINITLCDKVLKGDVPYYEEDNKEDAIELIHHWLSNKDFDNSVFVCFNNWDSTESEDYRGDQSSILVSFNMDDIEIMYETYIRECSNEDIDFAIFEFPTFEEAFMYCTDLKEGF